MLQYNILLPLHAMVHCLVLTAVHCRTLHTVVHCLVRIACCVAPSCWHCLLWCTVLLELHAVLHRPVGTAYCGCTVLLELHAVLHRPVSTAYCCALSHQNCMLWNTVMLILHAVVYSLTQNACCITRLVRTASCSTLVIELHAMQCVTYNCTPPRQNCTLWHTVL
jgi:hypothetical protein